MIAILEGRIGFCWGMVVRQMPFYDKYGNRIKGDGWRDFIPSICRKFGLSENEATVMCALHDASVILDRGRGGIPALVIPLARQFSPLRELLEEEDEFPIKQLDEILAGLERSGFLRVDSEGWVEWRIESIEWGPMVVSGPTRSLLSGSFEFFRVRPAAIHSEGYVLKDWMGRNLDYDIFDYLPPGRRTRFAFTPAVERMVRA